jgi:hypothetical protein
LGERRNPDIPFLGDRIMNGSARPELAYGRVQQFTAPSNKLGIVEQTA